ncbi:MAG: replication-relaxation family protein [Candidatus Uhrbacteria bacterium]
MLAAVGRMKIASTRHLRVFFGDRSTLARRIAKLFAAGLVVVWNPSQNGENRITLTPRGLRLAVAHGFAADDLHVARRVERDDVHLARLNDLRIAFVLASRARPEIEVAQFTSDHDLRRQLGVKAARRDVVIPDALVMLTAPGYEIRVALELDLATETGRQWSRKVRTTVERYRQGRDLLGLAHPWRALLVAPSEIRLRHLARVTAEEGGGELWIGALLGDVIADPYGPKYALVGEIAKTARDGKLSLARCIVPAPAVSS